jgi:hypothetical protein
MNQFLLEQGTSPDRNVLTVDGKKREESDGGLPDLSL